MTNSQSLSCMLHPFSSIPCWVPTTVCSLCSCSVCRIFCVCESTHLLLRLTPLVCVHTPTVSNGSFCTLPVPDSAQAPPLLDTSSTTVSNLDLSSSLACHLLNAHYLAVCGINADLEGSHCVSCCLLCLRVHLLLRGHILWGALFHCRPWARLCV